VSRDATRGVRATTFARLGAPPRAARRLLVSSDHGEIMKPDSKLAPNTTWLVAAFTLALAIGVTYAIPHITGPISPKAMAAVYFAVFGAGATLAMVITRAGALRAIAAFTLGGAGLGVFYYIVIGRAARAAAEDFGASASGASGVGATMGLVFALAFAVDALAAAVAGTLFGARLRRSLAG
jgi:hypothetical protein